MKVNKKLIGTLIRSARDDAGISQMALAERIGITYQQVQKYESGKSAVSVVRLYEIAEALAIPITSLLLTDTSHLKISEPGKMYGLLNSNEKRLIELIRKTNNKRLMGIFIKLLEEIVNE